jgi:hypothetical protein
MKTVTIEADATLDALQQLEIFHQSLKAIAVSLERQGCSLAISPSSRSPPRHSRR